MPTLKTAYADQRRQGLIAEGNSEIRILFMSDKRTT